VDPLFIGGLVVSILGIVVATLMDGNSFGPLIGPSSFVLVLLGALGASLMAHRTKELSRLVKAGVYVFKGAPPDPSVAVTHLASLADVARREGMLALEAKLGDIDDPFLRSGLQFVVDGLDAEQVRELLEIEMGAVDERHQLGIGFFKSLGGYAPTFGMIGTVVGLINMLQNLSDPSQLGIGMSLALLTTLYGVMFANLIFLPIANKLEHLNGLELSARDVAVDGITAIQAGLSPRMLVERLETYLAPEQRIGHHARMAGETAPAAAPQEAEAA
jgi:chemotaxis protein MotA